MTDQAEKLRQMVKQRQQEENKISLQSSPLPGRILTITSGKGGVGKTNLAANLAISFSLMGKRVLVMDADLGLSNVNVVIGLIPPPQYNLYHVIAGEKTISEVVADGPCGVKVISGAVGVTKVSNMSAKKRKEFITSLKGLFDRFEWIIIDTSAGISSNVLSFILAADEVILVTTPEPTAITDAYGVIKAVSSKSKDVHLKLVVNRIANVLEGKKVADRIVDIASQFLGMRVEKIGYILDDPLVAKSVMQQKPFFLTYPKSKATDCIYHIRNKLVEIPEEDFAPSGLAGFFKRLFKGGSQEEEV